MKNNKLIVFVFFLALLTFSCKKDDVEEVVETDDYTIKVGDNDLINGAEYVYNDIGAENADLDIIIKNTSDAKINFKIKTISINEGATGVEFSLCIGNCYTFDATLGALEVGDLFPLGDEIYSLNAGESSAHGDVHMYNTDDRSGDLSYEFKLYQVDENGNELTSEKSVQFTYKYVAP